MKSLYQRALLAISVLALTACGGGSSGSPNDTGRDDDGGQVLQLLRSGVYNIGMWVEYTGWPPTSSVTLYRDRLSVTNGYFQKNSDFLTSGGWIAAEDLFNSEPTYFVTLTASGWQNREGNPCSLDVTSNGAMLSCVEKKALVALEPVADLSAFSLASTFTHIAATELHYDNDAYQAVVASTATLTQALGPNARSYQLTTVAQVPEVYSIACEPTNLNQLISEWSCNTEFTSTSWQELALNDEVFSVSYMEGQSERSIQVWLDGDLDNASSGNIVVANDYQEGFAPGNVIGTWEKLNIHGQSVIRLLRFYWDYSDYAGVTFDALAIINGQMVRALYEPAGSQSSVLVLNSEAGVPLSDSAVGVFPITQSE